ncbi:MAG TPA: hypothetical protein PKN33_15155 [Phycisphaerae bacterium]|nr:hypothetical protein [Phycisphaerales bacterium]HNO79387.1 hypothetical protein [Phycisphaerae bacterium]
MKVTRSMFQRYRMQDAAETKARNNIVKTKENARRDARMMETVKSGSLPYTPAVMSWLSRKLDKPSSKLTQEDIAKLSS